MGRGDDEIAFLQLGAKLPRRMGASVQDLAPERLRQSDGEDEAVDMVWRHQADDPRGRARISLSSAASAAMSSRRCTQVLGDPVLPDVWNVTFRQPYSSDLATMAHQRPIVFSISR